MITDPKELASWLADLRKQPVARCFTELQGYLGNLGSASMAPERRFALSELIRNALPAVVASLPKGYYADKPLPLAASEREMLGRVHTLFASLQEQYWQCAEGYEEQPASPQRQQNLATALQRALHAIVSLMIEDYRARQAIDPAFWDRLNQLLDKAHTHGIGNLRVADGLNPNAKSSIDTTYGRAILLAAVQPGAMTPRNLDGTLALTALLEPYIDCTWQAQSAAENTDGLTRTGRLRVLRKAGMTHLLNNTRLGVALQSVSQKLAADEPVPSLDALPIARTELTSLLSRLHRVWCGAGEIRATAREPANERVEMASGAHAIFSLMSKAEFEVPRQFHLYTGGPNSGQATLKTVITKSGDSGTWQLLDRSAGGLRAKRSVQGARLMRSCLIGIHDDRGDPLAQFSLGEIRWVQEERDAALFAGIKLLSGEAQPMVARLLGGVGGNQYQEIGPAFVLENAAAPKLVVPNGWWKPDRVIDVFKNGSYPRLRMGELLMRGMDFEVGRFAVEESSGR